MFSLSGKVPGYLLGKYQMTAIVVFTLLFATVFILLAAPYPGNTFFILATLILALSRFILYRVSRRSAPTYLKYIVWCVLEAVFISLLYIFLKSPEKCFQMLGDTFVKAVFALAPPHLIAGLYFSLQEKERCFTGGIRPEIAVTDHAVIKGNTIFCKNLLKNIYPFLGKDITGDAGHHMRMPGMMILDDMTRDLFKALCIIKTNVNGIFIGTVNDDHRNMILF